MEFIRSLAQLRPRHQPCVATIGNFDGIHCGHQAVIRQLQHHAHNRRLPATVIIFEPQPAEFFTPGSAPARLTRLRDKLLIFQDMQVDNVLCLRFNQQFAALSPQAFIHKVLVKGLAVKHLVVGDDFHFGRGREGNFQTLQAAGQQYNFTVEHQNTLVKQDKRVSSTWVREALEQGDMNLARELLGHYYRLSGRVRYGQQRGRQIGFPTANIFLHRHKSPLYGVFAVKIHGLKTQPLAGIANLGRRPTMGETEVLLEVHIFNFQEMIYGRYVEIEFIRKIREERRFPSFEDLKQQIQKDVVLATQLLAEM